MQHLDDYRLFLEKRTELQQIPFLKNEIEYYGKLSEQLGVKDSILADEIGLAEKKSARMREAKSFGGVSADEVEQAEATVLQQKRTKRDLNLQRLEYQIKINNLKKQIGDIRQRTQETAQSRYLLLKEFYQRLRAAVDTWLSSYIVTSPIAGEVAFLQLWSERQYVKEGTALMSVIPKGEGLIGRLTLPVQGSGKVELGQKVNVELLAFPRHEYGMLQGKVEKISLLPQNNSLIVEISLPSGMKTNYKKQLSFRPNMQGRAEIITKPRRLLQRLLDLMFAGRT
jgi:HlyD family secretion protein